jgi:hypothetical protein
MLMVSGQ